MMRTTAWLESRSTNHLRSGLHQHTKGSLDQSRTFWTRRAVANQFNNSKEGCFWMVLTKTYWQCTHWYQREHNWNNCASFRLFERHSVHISGSKRHHRAVKVLNLLLILWCGIMNLRCRMRRKRIGIGRSLACPRFNRRKPRHLYHLFSRTAKFTRGARVTRNGAMPWVPGTGAENTPDPERRKALEICTMTSQKKIISHGLECGRGSGAAQPSYLQSSDNCFQAFDRQRWATASGHPALVLIGGSHD